MTPEEQNALEDRLNGRIELLLEGKLKTLLYKLLKRSLKRRRYPK